LVGFGLALAAVAAIGSIGVAYALPGFAGKHLPTTASVIIVWGAGVMLAFGGALRALARDWEDGTIALLRARGIAASSYVGARVGGLVILLVLAVGGATLVAALAASAVARPPLAAVRTGLSALAYALAFAVTMGPLAMAALGARTRAGGYLTLIAVLVVPELAASWTSALLPSGWNELCSVPAALEAIRAFILSPRGSGAHVARAVAGLAAVVVVSLAVVRARVPRAEAGAGG
jgi:hypothetical protein